MVLVAMLLGIVSVSASVDEKNINLSSSPQKIFVRYDIEVTIIPSNRNMIVVEGGRKALKEFRHTYKNGTLVIKRKKGFIRRLFTGDLEVKLYVSDVNKINTINASGASEVELNSDLSLGLRNIAASGASVIYLNGKLQGLKANISGASKLEFIGSARQMTLDVSGASRVDLMVTSIGNLNTDISGASRVELEGRVGRLDADVSGASKLEADDALVDIASLEASGASTINVDAKKVEKSRASGGSEIY